MINTFTLKNFRHFDSLKINKLSYVNLYVGKNNAGKSALLEALILYFTRFDPDQLLEILTSRQEHWEQGLEKYNSRKVTSPFRHFFRGHVIPDLSKDGLVLSSNLSSIRVSVAPYIREENEKGIKRTRLEQYELLNYDADFIQDCFVFEEDNDVQHIIPLDDDVISFKKKRPLLRKKVTELPCQFVPTQGVSDTKLSALWDSISLTKLEDDVVTGLQLLDANVTGIAFVESREQKYDWRRKESVRIPLIKMSNSDEPMPLKSLGDGITRIFQIVLSLVCAKNGVLIVDEFENGLHWSVQDKIWRLVFKLAEKLNVQVFCSTHSRDCVAGFQKVWLENPDSASFSRIYRKQRERVFIQEYDLGLLSDSIEMEVEVR